jgi:hypothetical protein
MTPFDPVTWLVLVLSVMLGGAIWWIAKNV